MNNFLDFASEPKYTESTEFIMNIAANINGSSQLNQPLCGLALLPVRLRRLPLKPGILRT